jgi:hypothetical protein
MKIAAARLLASCFLLLAANSAHACCLWPFCGWGMGYGPAYPMAPQAWGGYSTYYTPWYAAPAYPAWNGCCPTTCCDPCNSCSSGACGTPAQDSQGTSGSLKPKTDPAFQDRRSPPVTDDVSPSSRTLPPVENLDQPADAAPNDTFTPTPPARRQPIAPADSFDAPADPANPAEPAPFESNESISNKPPVSDPDNSAPVKPENDPLPPTDSFSDPGAVNDPPAGTGTGTGPQSRRTPVPKSSQLAEVVAPKRLAAGTRVPAAGSVNKSTTNASRDRLRWISNPAPETHARL